MAGLSLVTYLATHLRHMSRLITTVDLGQEFENTRHPLKTLISRASKGVYLATKRRLQTPVKDARGTVVSETRKLRTPLTPAESSALAASYQQGVGVVELARKYKIHRDTVHEHLKRHRLARPINYFTSELGDQAAKLYQAGMTLSQVAKEIGSNTRSVTLALEERGIPRRPRGVSLMSKIPTLAESPS